MVGKKGVGIEIWNRLVETISEEAVNTSYDAIYNTGNASGCRRFFSVPL